MTKKKKRRDQVFLMDVVMQDWLMRLNHEERKTLKKKLNKKLGSR